EGDRPRRWVIEPSLHLEVPAAMLDLLTAPESADNRNRLYQSFGALLILAPATRGRLFIQGLAGADAKVHAARGQLAERGERLGHDRRLVTKAGTGHRRAHP